MTQISKITIDQLTEATYVEVNDRLLLSRGGVFFKVRPAILQGGLLKITRTLTSAEVLASNGTPIVLLAAQGAQTIIDPVSVGLTLNYNTTTYATATHFRLHNSGQTNYMAKTSASFIQSAVSRREVMMKDNSADANYVMHTNTAIVISANAVPITGNSPVLISALFRVIQF